MNKTEFLNPNPHATKKEYRPGDLFRLEGSGLFIGEIHVVSHIDGMYAFISINDGESYFGEALDEEAFSKEMDNEDIVKVTEPFTVTPCLN